MKKAVSLCLCIAMLISCFSGFTVANAASDVFNVDTIIECEDGKLAKEMNKVKEKTASGGKYIATEGNEKTESPELDKPEASWTVKIPEDGTYTVYLKTHMKSGGVDSFHIWWDDGTGFKTSHPGENSDWTWLEATTVSLTAGEHKLCLTTREKGAWWDCVFVTNDKSKLPAIEKWIYGDPSEIVASDGGKLNDVKTIKTTDGSVMIEAEDIIVDTSNVSVVSDEAAVGKKAVTMIFDDRNKPASNVAGGLQFVLEADTAGTHYIWARMVVQGAGSDSGWAMLNGAYAQLQINQYSADEKDYFWTKIGVFNNMTVGAKADFRYRGRETGAKIDRILVTSNGAYTPSGEGRAPEKGEIYIQKLDETRYPTPTILPNKGEHPRVLFKASDIPTIIENMDSAQNSGAKQAWEKAKARDVDEGIMKENTGNGNYTFNTLETVEALAFDYAVFGNRESGEKAVQYTKNMITTADFNGDSFETRTLGHLIFVASEAYDWCHDLFSEDDKKLIVSRCEMYAGLMEMGWPPVGQGAVCGHGCEAQLLRDFLAFGIATYDEYPDIYNFCAGRVLSEYLEPTEYWYKSHMHHQGSAYGVYRWGYTMQAEELLRVLTDGEHVFTDETPNVGYGFLYFRRPDGQSFRLGDDYNEKNYGLTSYWTYIGSPMSLAANLYGDEYMKKEYFIENKNLASFSGGEGFYTAVRHLITNDPSVGTQPVGQLPLTKYFGSPSGMMVARTGWNMGMNSPDVVALMKIGETWGGNHDHLDAGTFQLYYKGILASESGCYDLYGTTHDGGYNKKTIAHNALLIDDPDEAVSGYYTPTHDGGQRFPNNAQEPANMEIWMKPENNYERAKVIGHEYGPDTQYPEYSYLAGDITNSYSDKVDKVLRSMLFVNTNDTDHPGVMVVMDKVVSANKSFKKTWLLHMQEEPKVEGNKTYVTRTENGNNGRMVNETLLPKDAAVTKVGGENKEFMIGDKNYEITTAIKPTQPVESGWGRVEVSPSSANETDYFLNVMTVSDYDTQAVDIDSKLIEGDNYAGAIFNGNYAAVFAKDSAEKISDSLSFTLDGDGTYKVFVGGLKAGTWTINGNETQVASEDGGCIWFEASAGTVEIAYTDTASAKEFTATPAPELEGISIMVSNNFIYSDVAPTIVDGRTLVPMRAIFEALGADVSWDEASATATATLNDNVLKITENATTAYLDGEELTLDVPAMIRDGRFVVPVRFVSESFGAKVEWDEYSYVIRIYPGVVRPKVEKQDGYALIASSSSSEDSEDNVHSNTYDNDVTTLWSAQGEHYVNYVFDKEYTIDAVEIMLNQNAGRDAKFELLYSTDGENYTSLYDGHGDGTVGNYKWETFEFTPVTAKYFRYFAKGSNISMWNGLIEIRFREQK